MKKMIWFFLILAIVILFAGCDESQNIEQTIPGDPIISTPITKPVNYDLFENSFGFASLMITNRSEIEEGYYIADDEESFLEALIQEDAKIIEVTNDLNMGSLEVIEQLAVNSKPVSLYFDVYRPHSRQALLHPTLIESGVGLIRILDRENLTIFSKTGVTIKHASFSIDSSHNIMFRNLHLSELWEWDELNTGTYKRNDWDYFTVQESQGVWFDHLTFDQAYDGIIDVKEYSSNLTLSWSKLNFVPNSFIEDQINYLEQNQEENPFYKSIRGKGISVSDIITLASCQKKGFNIGNSTDGEGFESITFTFHHLEVFNLMDRMPRIRRGDAHLYQIIVDNEDLYQLRLRISDPAISLVNQGIITTEQGAVLMENSIFKYVSSPIKNHQDSNPDDKYTGKYNVINSEWVMPQRTFFGSTSDINSLWIHASQDVVVPFEFRNYESIPYEYKLEDIYYLPETFEEYPTGHQTIEDFDWLYINTNITG